MSPVQYRTRIERLREEKDDQARRVQRAQLDAERAASRARWAPGNDRSWLREADLLDVAGVWAAAVPFADPNKELFEDSAESAMANCESRLRELHPYAMSRYDRLRADSTEPVEAMYEALPLFTRPPHAYERMAETRPALSPGGGLGFEWTAAPHGPTRADMEDGQQRQRGARILGQIQARAVWETGAALDPDEQHAALEAGTSLTPAQIAATVRTAPAAPGSPRPWRQDFPFPIREVLAVTSAARERGQGAPTVQLPPRQRDAHQHPAR